MPSLQFHYPKSNDRSGLNLQSNFVWDLGFHLRRNGGSDKRDDISGWGNCRTISHVPSGAASFRMTILITVSAILHLAVRIQTMNVFRVMLNYRSSTW